MRGCLSIWLACVALAACSKEGEAGSCLRPVENVCVEYNGSQGAAGKRMCSGMTWTRGEKSCPTAQRLGSCVKQGQIEHVYAGAPNNYTPASAKSSCEFGGGSFKASP